MNFTVNRTELNKAIKVVFPAIKSSVVIPICETIKFDISKEALMLTATNIQVEISAKIDGKFKEEFSFCLPAAKLKNLVENLPDQPLSFTVEDICLIKTSSGKYELPISDSVDFPIFKGETDKNIAIGSAEFATAIKKTIFACSTDFEEKPQQTGVFIEVAGSRISFTSTDAHRINHVEYPLESELETSLIIPAVSLALLPELSGSLQIDFSANSISISSGNISFKSTLIDAKFPDYKVVIPVNDKILTTERVTFLSALKRVSGFSSSKTNLLKLEAGTKVILSGQNVEYSEYGEEEIKGDYPYEELAIGLSCEYLTESVSAMGGSELFLLLSAPNRGVLLKESLESTDYIMVMPIQLT